LNPVRQIGAADLDAAGAPTNQQEADLDGEAARRARCRMHRVNGWRA